MNRRTIAVRIAQFEGEVGEAVLGGERNRSRTDSGITQEEGIALEGEYRERATSLDGSAKSERGQSLSQRLRAQP